MSAFSNTFKDSTGSFNMAEIGGTMGLLTYLTLVICDHFQHNKMVDGRDFAFVVGGIISAIGAAQYMRGDRDIDKARAADQQCSHT